MPDRNRQPQAQQPLTLGELLLLASLWMLLGFVLWYYLSAFHVVPARLAAEAILQQVLEGDFRRIIAEPNEHFLFLVETNIPFTFPDGSREALGFIINPLIFSYGLPLLFGLVMGSDVGWRRKLTLIGTGYVVITAVQIWGVVWGSLKLLAFNFGDPALDVVRAHAISETAIALCYQLGTLILPALAPIIIWVLGNRALVEQFVGWGPPSPAGGEGRGRNP